MIVVDTSLVVAYMNRTDTHHDAARGWIAALDDDLITTPLILAEIDHLLSTRGGARAAQAFRQDLKAGAYLVDWWPGAVVAMVDVADRYADMALGLADASLVVLADRHLTEEIATFDHRHFRAIAPLGSATAFRLLPADAN